MTGLIVALDTADLATARNWAASVAPHCAMLKLGLQFFCTHGPAEVARLSSPRLPHPLFLDLKLHDIPATVAASVAALTPLNARMLTLHASGGAAMIAAARAAVDAAPPPARPLLLAVTVLTSLDAAALSTVGVAGGARQQVLRLARAALAAGADGLVCSGHEVSMLRDAFGAAPVLVVPGIRPEGEPTHDQARVMTPAAAAQAGATYIVVGRPITASPDPAAAAAALAATLAAARA